MSDLGALQRAFAAALTARTADNLDVAPFAGPPDLVRSRLRLYRGNLHATRRKALENAFPICARLVGDAFFGGLADEYGTQVPSFSGDLDEYGDAFADFLAAFAPVKEQAPYLPDVAKLEWRVHAAHYAADAPPLDAAALARESVERLAQIRLVRGPATALLESAWPVASIWRAHHDEGDLDAIDVNAGGEYALVFRPRFRVYVVALGRAEHAFLTAIGNEATFEPALACALAADPAFDVEPALQRWMGDRVIVGVVPAPH